MAIVGAILLVLVLLVRPMEIMPEIGKVRPLEVLTATTTLAILYEAANRRTKLGAPPQIPWLIAFVVWSFFVTMFRLGRADGFRMTWLTVGFGAIFLTLIAFAAATPKRLVAMSFALTITLGVVAAIAVHQGMQVRQCIEVVITPDEEEHFPDGRECEGRHGCERGGKENADYECERVGLVGTISTGGRVRYRGQLGDPNEMSVFVGAGLPLVFLLGARRGRWWKVFFVAPIVAVSLWAVVLSQSRTGVLVIGAISLIALVRRFGWKGAVLAAAAIFPLMLLGGREGAEADSSSLERATILYEGVDVVRAYPFLGVGVGQFVDAISIPMTAHNSYLLAAAELGLMGLVLWGGMLWVSMKIALAVTYQPPPGIDPELIRFAEALVVSLVAIFVGIFFLSFCYKQLLFVWLGLAAALYRAVRAQAPSFKVETTRRDVVGLVVSSAVILIAIFVISRVKGGG